MNAPVPAARSALARLSLPVSGMSCAGCATRIQSALAALPGVSDAGVNYATERASVDYDPDRIAAGAVVAAVERAGYDVPPQVVRLRITGMTCASCAGRVERALASVEGVPSARVSVATELATVAVTPGVASTDQLIAAVHAAGYRGELARTEAAERKARDVALRRAGRREAWILVGAGVASAVLMAPMVLGPLGVPFVVPGIAQLVLAAAVQVVAGARFYRGAYRALAAGAANMDVLVAMGTTAAFVLSVVLLTTGGHLYFESAAAIITFVRLGKFLETRAKHATTHALRALMDLRPETARVRRGDGDVEVPVQAVAQGDVVVVRPGERVPVDGRILEGDSELDESLITGESAPLTKSPGGIVTGGSINGAGLLVVEATRVGEASTLSRIGTLVSDAQASKAPVQHAVDRVSAVFVPVVAAIAAASLIGWLLAGAGAQSAVVVAVSVLVIACPCALGLATPAALVVGTGAAARAGIMIRDADALQRARSVDTVVLDKTGTLTEGRPSVQEVLAERDDALLAVTAAVQEGSEHPLAAAIRSAAEARSLPAVEASDFEALPGRGMRATVDGATLWVGSPRLMRERGVSLGRWHARAEELQAAGCTVMWVARDDRLLGGIATADALRPGSREAVSRLRALGIDVVMLTGDSEAAAQSVASQLGISRVLAEVLPEDKQRHVETLRADGRVVAMVGDGVNDAPALAAADVGVAMGSGTDVARQTAGITLMRSDPRLVADAIDVSRATTAKIRQNLFWAFAYNAVGIPLAVAGVLSPMIAGAAMAMSSVSVAANALLLRRWRASA
ncbi:MAG: copper-translocating P-type ATPase [Myxococcota bacterium]